MAGWLHRLSSVLEGGLGRTVGSFMEGGVQVGGWGRELTDGEEEVQPDFLGCCVPPLALMDGTMTVY